MNSNHNMIERYADEPIIYDLKCNKFSNNKVVKFSIRMFKSPFKLKVDTELKIKPDYSTPLFDSVDFIIMNYNRDYVFICKGKGNYEIHFDINDDLIIEIQLATPHYKTRMRSTMVCVGDKPICDIFK